MRLWRLRAGALAAVIAFALAPAARAACVARCVPAAPTASSGSDAPVADAHHGHHQAEAPSRTLATSRTTAAALRQDRGCGVPRDTLAAPSGRAVLDTVPLAAATLPAIRRAPDLACPSRRSVPPARPPGSASTPLPLRI